MARSLRDGRVEDGRSTHRLERDEERSLEGGDSGSRIGIPDRVGRQAVRADRDSRRVEWRRSTSAARWHPAYVPSPLLYDGTLYFLKTNSGVLSAYDATTGKPHYQLQRLEGVPNVFASPVAAQGRISCRP